MATSAITDVYVSELLESGKLAEAPYVNGARTITVIETEELPIADGSANIDIYRFFKGLNPNLIITQLKVYVDDAVAGATDCDLGLYEQNGGVVVDVDAFADGVDLSQAGGHVRGGGVIDTDEFLDGLKAVDIVNLTKKLYEHVGHTVKNYKQGYDLALTINSNVTTGGTVTIIAQFIEG
ncbi:hypothetical protein LCGC14_1459720 [marine sediment metagenome]|uniref:Uncharacterized protein n=1 Tax=marine sediment metagenome TaxID=412755 RepID=A0A0F9LW22_9ZZZZ